MVVSGERTFTGSQPTSNWSLARGYSDLVLSKNLVNVQHAQTHEDMECSGEEVMGSTTVAIHVMRGLSSGIRDIRPPMCLNCYTIDHDMPSLPGAVEPGLRSSHHHVQGCKHKCFQNLPRDTLRKKVCIALCIRRDPPGNNQPRA